MVTVSGEGSIWANSSELDVGLFGTGELTISEGGSVSNWSGYIGANNGSSGTVTVTGEGSIWSNSYGLYVGNSGTGELTVENGGQVSAGTLYVL